MSSKQKTLTSTYGKESWEGIPFNFLMNSFLFGAMIIAFSIVRRKAWNNRSKQLTRTHKGWLQFIYGDREPRLTEPQQQYRESHNHDVKAPGLLVPPAMLASFQIEKQLDSDEDNTSLSKKEFMEKIPFDTWRVRTKKRKDELEEEDFERQERKAEYNVQRGQFMRSMSTESLIQFGYWLLDLLLIRDREIYRHKGRDAVQYLIFQRYIIYFLLLLTIICMVIVLPINLQGTEASDTQHFQRTTMSNLSRFSPYLWVHVTLSMVLLPIGIYMMCHFSRIIKVEEELVCSKTLFIRKIPKSKRTKEIIFNLLTKNIKDLKIEAIQFVYDARSLTNMYIDYNNVINAKYYCEEYFIEYNERFEGRPYLFGKYGGILCCCYCCPKVDGLEYYNRTQRQLEKDIEKEYANCVSNQTGSLFITLATAEMAQNVKSFITFQRQEINPVYTCCGWCYRLLVWLLSFCRRESDDFQIHNWLISNAPYPDDINWSDIPVDYKMIWLRRIGINIWLFIMFFFFSTPSILLTTYSQFEGTFSEKVKNFSPLLTAYITPLLLVLAGTILPVFVRIGSEYLPYTTISDKNHSIMFKTFFFLIMMTVILPSLGYNNAQTLIQTLFEKNGTFPWMNITYGTGSLFTNYVIQSALLGNAMELLRFPELFLYIFFMNFFSRTIAEYDIARQLVMFEFQFGVLYSRFLLIFFMVVVYSLSCPLIAPCGLLYMILKHLVDRYNIYYVYHPSRISVHVHSTAINFFHFSIIMLQIQVFATLLSQESFSNRTNILMIGLVLGVLVFVGQWLYSWINVFSFRRKPKATEVSKTEYCSCSYAPPVLYELNTRGIIPLDQLAGVQIAKGTIS